MSILFNVILTTDSTDSIQSINNDRHCIICMYNWDLADYDNIGLYLSDVDWYNLVAMYPSAPALWNVFMSILNHAIELYVPKRRVA